MGDVRRATIRDADELVRLRVVLLSSMAGGAPVDGGWQAVSRETLRNRLAQAEATMAAFVVDRRDPPAGLAACAVGTIEYRLGGPARPTGEVGYVFSVATDPDQRRRGYSRACVTALLDWFRERGVGVIDLRASEEGEPLYRSLGFVRTGDPAMRLILPDGRSEVDPGVK